MKLKITLISIVLLLFGCDDGNEHKREGIEWTKLGLDGKVVNEMLEKVFADRRTI